MYRCSAFFVFLLILTSCQLAPSLKGKWKLVKMDYTPFVQTMTEEEAEMFQSQIQSHIDLITNRTFFTFEDKNVLYIASPKSEGGSAVDSGNWRTNEDLDSLYFYMESPERYSIGWKGRDTVELRTEDRPQRILTLSRER